MSEAVNEYFQKVNQDWQAEICRQLHAIVHQVVAAVEERLQYGKPHYLKNSKYVAVIGTAKDWVSFTIFNASNLEAEEGFFEPGSPDRKTLKIRKGQVVDYERLAGFLQQAVATV